MRHKRRLSSFSVVHAGIFALVILILIVAVGGFLFAVEDGGGVVATKWTEVSTSTSCDDDGTNCHTTSTTHYFVQLRDGRSYGVWFGWLAWQGLQPGQYISFQARGFRWEPLGLRIFVPAITSYTVLEDSAR